MLYGLSYSSTRASRPLVEVRVPVPDDVYVCFTEPVLVHNSLFGDWREVTSVRVRPESVMVEDGHVLIYAGRNTLLMPFEAIASMSQGFTWGYEYR